MTPDDIETLANTLAPYGISFCEIHDSQRDLAVSIRLRAETQIEPSQVPAQASSSAMVAKPGASNVLRSPGMGHFATKHPLQDSPAASAGQHVEVGRVVGYLLAGALVSEITTPQSGILGKQLVEEGELLGFGDAVFELT